MQKNIGYSEIEHTADWELHVWAPDLTTLLEIAARGMYDLSNTELAAGSREMCEFVIPFVDRETLLVDFLAELLFLSEDEGIAFDDYQLRLNSGILKVKASGGPIQNQAKEIKAVTYHGLQIRETKRGLEVRIVFDV